MCKISVIAGEYFKPLRFQYQNVPCSDGNGTMVTLVAKILKILHKFRKTVGIYSEDYTRVNIPLVLVSDVQCP